MNLNILFILCPLIFLAGFIDAIAGGGGLISLNSYIVCGIPTTLALGTNKFSALIGTTVASANFIKTKNYDLHTLICAFISALIGSWLGAEATMLINQKVFFVLMLIITPIILFFVLFNPKTSQEEKDFSLFRRFFTSILIGLIIGFYDGFYGPGAGTFMQMGFTLLTGLNAKKSCGNARMVNWASNCGSLLNFIRMGNVLYQVAIPCAIFSIIGNYVGSCLAIKKDVKIIKPIMILVVGFLMIKLIMDLL